MEGVRVRFRKGDKRAWRMWEREINGALRNEGY